MKTAHRVKCAVAPLKELVGYIDRFPLPRRIFTKIGRDIVYFSSSVARKEKSSIKSCKRSRPSRVRGSRGGENFARLKSFDNARKSYLESQMDGWIYYPKPVVYCIISNQVLIVGIQKLLKLHTHIQRERESPTVSSGLLVYLVRPVQRIDGRAVVASGGTVSFTSFRSI